MSSIPASRPVAAWLSGIALWIGLGVAAAAPPSSAAPATSRFEPACGRDEACEVWRQFRRNHPFAQLDLADTREELKARGGGSVTRGALEFVLAHPAVTGAIVGIRNEREARDLAALV